MSTRDYLVLMITVARGLIMKFPNAIYQSDSEFECCMSCSYVEGDVLNGPPEKGCIWGHVARILGEQGISACKDIKCGLGINQILDKRYPDLWMNDEDFKLYNWITEVQTKQDSKVTWLTAMKAADEAYPIPV